MRLLQRVGALAVVSLFGSLSALGQGSLTGDVERGARAREAMTELDVVRARAILADADPADPVLALERGRLAIHAQDSGEAARVLARPDLLATAEGAELNAIARGSARALAATVLVRDEARGVDVRLQDDDDLALVPYVVEVAARARELLAAELGVTLPRPIHVVLVRDQFTLAAMTGLPEEAARTTGTVAVAKWGRVTMLSPRAMSGGYAWLDTLVHELTHLALTQGSRDKAPLWLQEGVAKRQETRWRKAEPSDDAATADAVAAAGLQRGLGVPIDQLGPSIAMLPTAEHARVAFAEVESFLHYWLREAGDEALPQLLLRIKVSTGRAADVARAIEEVSGADFATWDQRWRGHLTTTAPILPAELQPGGALPSLREIQRRARLGELLRRRGHAGAAVLELARAQALAPAEPALRANLAEALLSDDDRDEATRIVEPKEELRGRHGRYHSLKAHLSKGVDPSALYQMAIALDPLEPAIACEELAPPAKPSDPTRAALCEAARRAPRASF